MAKLVNEMVDELNSEIPGWLERKRQIEEVSENGLVLFEYLIKESQKKAAREMKAKQAGRSL